MLRFLWLTIAAVLAASMLRTIWLSRQAQREMEKRREAVEAVEKQVEKLEQEVREATSSFTLEKRVREELDLHKDDETVIRVVP